MSGERPQASLREVDLASSWVAQLERWLGDARAAELHQPEAMVLATADAEGQPSARTVLLKGLDERGLEFFTNLGSRKGRELAANPRASAVFPWYPLQRQAVVVGTVEPVAAARADEYFASRPYGSQVSAIASRQSSVVPDRAALASARAEALARWPQGGPVPRPCYWGGLRLVPSSVEFWQGRRDRFHDRLRFRREDGGAWLLERLSP
jgi:pyridoxamine 5'-phosphate oxidase